MREIVFDTETTGLDVAGERLIEIGCVELANSIPTGRTWHRYVNPEKSVSAGAAAVHGLNDAFLRDKPLFAEVVEDFLTFVGDSLLVAHNADFDRGFINMELDRCGLKPFAEERFVDTLALARRRHPGGSNSLDALCARYRIDNSNRIKHGALLDAELLSEVYIELLGGRQASLVLDRDIAGRAAGEVVAALPARARPLAPRLSAEDAARHRAFVETLSDKPVWTRYPQINEAA